ncbi:hypothetical protein NEOC65_001375 [Neochlamydia sp. AcF65]|nr:hypothetical protein [Neochlamydia sp. AcF65]
MLLAEFASLVLLLKRYSPDSASCNDPKILFLSNFDKLILAYLTHYFLWFSENKKAVEFKLKN